MCFSITVTRRWPSGLRLSEWSEFLPLVWLPLLLGWLDIAVTLLVQPSGYWAGDYALAVDFNPLVVWALGIHPAMAIVGALGWAAVIAGHMAITRGNLRALAYAFLVVGHLVCVAGWVNQMWPEWMPAVWIASIVVALIGWPQFRRAGDR